MAPAYNQNKIIKFALNFLAANFDSATKSAPVSFRVEDVVELEEKFSEEPEKNMAISYLYRDKASYKNKSRIILTGTPKDLGKFIVQLRKYLDDKDWFVAAQIGVPSVFFDTRGKDDHGWHELSCIEETTEQPTDSRTPAEFLKAVVRAAKSGWKPENTAPNVC